MHKPLAAALAAVVVVALAVVLLNRLGTGTRDGAPGGATATTATATAPVTRAGTEGDATVAAPEDAAPGTAHTGAPGPDGEGGTSGDGGTDGVESEVIPQAGTAPTSLADLLPTDAPSAGTYDTAPADAEATDALATGFPAQVIYVPDAATVRSSSITTDAGRSQAALDAVAQGPCNALLIAARDWYSRGGFTEHTTSETPEGAMIEFRRDDASVAITTRPQGEDCELVAHGVLTPSGTTR